MIHWSKDSTKLKNTYTKRESDNRYILKNMTSDTTVTNTRNTIFRSNIVNISSTGENANVELRPNGTGGVDVGGKRIKTCSGIESGSGDINLVVPTGASVNMNSRHISNLANPTQNQHAATKAYVDSGKVLRVINKANITITRINNIGASDVNGMYCKITFNNAEDRTFINAAARARKDISFYFAWDNIHLHKLSNISFFESSSALGGVCFAHLPAFWDNAKLTDFFNKGFTKFEILTIGV